MKSIVPTYVTSYIQKQQKFSKLQPHEGIRAGAGKSIVPTYVASYIQKQQKFSKL